jgi:aerobic carbon-monoxide dehydrogenase medium subunit
MKSAPFAYDAPETIDAAVALLAEHGADAKLLAGGQSLVPLMNLRLAKPSVLIDINRIASLQYIRLEADGSLAIGAGTRQSAAERSPEIARRWPVLVEALRQVGHITIRNRGTIGGTLACRSDGRAAHPCGRPRRDLPSDRPARGADGPGPRSLPVLPHHGPRAGRDPD